MSIDTEFEQTRTELEKILIPQLIKGPPKQTNVPTFKSPAKLRIKKDKKVKNKNRKCPENVL